MIKLFKILSKVIIWISKPDTFIIYHQKKNNTKVVFNGETKFDVEDYLGNNNHLKWGFKDITST